MTKDIYENGDMVEANLGSPGNFTLTILKVKEDFKVFHKDNMRVNCYNPKNKGGILGVHRGRIKSFFPKDLYPEYYL